MQNSHIDCENYKVCGLFCGGGEDKLQQFLKEVW